MARAGTRVPARGTFVELLEDEGRCWMLAEPAEVGPARADRRITAEVESVLLEQHGWTNRSLLKGQPEVFKHTEQSMVMRVPGNEAKDLAPGTRIEEGRTERSSLTAFGVVDRTATGSERSQCHRTCSRSTPRGTRDTTFRTLCVRILT